MFRIDNPTAVPSLPLVPPVGTPGFFTKGDELTALKPTHVDDWFLNMLQEELYTVVTRAGLTPNKNDNTQLWQALQLRAPRMVLHQATTFYVNGNPGAGSDLNDGLTPATAWATLQHACNYLLSNVDFNFQVVTLQIADCGTAYGSFNLAGIPVGCYATSQFLITGNLANPANVTVQSATAGVPAFMAFNSAICTVQGFTVVNTGGATGGSTFTSGIVSASNAQVVVQNMRFGSCVNGSHMLGDLGGHIQLSGNYTVVGPAQAHLFVGTLGYIGNAGLGGAIGGSLPPPIVITVTGNPTFSVAFALGTSNGLMLVGSNNTSFTGTAVGKHYQVDSNACIDTNNSGATFFPGSLPVTADSTTGGVYV